MNELATVVAPMVHEGEQAVQKRVEEGSPRHGSPMFDGRIPDGYAAFFAARQMVVLGAVADDGTVWASALTGPAGFARAIDESTIRFAACPPSGDPLADLVAAEGAGLPGAMIAIDPAESRRVRANGRLLRDGNDLVMRTEQVLRNCKKYIQHREPTATGGGPAGPPIVARATALSPAQQRWIEAADTFFVASHSPHHGADVSHRGGRPGFVTALDERHLSWPDYAGNSFYMTFGNLEFTPLCGLLFVDWERGHALHLAGECRIDWNDRSAPGARRTAHFRVQRVIQVDNATAVRWKLIEHSPFNP